MILDALLAKIAPYECLGCGQEGSLICVACSAKLQPIPARCYRCHRVGEGYKTCQTCRGHSELFSVFVAATYEGIAKDIIWKLKFEGAQKAAEEMARYMKTVLADYDDAIIVPVPTATSRVRKRGYDQAVLLARATARQTDTPYASCLRRSGQNEQLGARRQQRVTQLQQAYHCASPGAIRGRHVVLVDDVLTTGATLEAAARVIKEAGAKRVSSLVFAQA